MCNNACGAGMTCVELSEDNWGCSTPLPTECAGVTCGAGQTACIADTCSCMPFTETSIDTCASVGRVCRASWNSEGPRTPRRDYSITRRLRAFNSLRRAFRAARRI